MYAQSAVRTPEMTDNQLKELVKDRAKDEGLDPSDPAKRYTIWSENGIWSTEGRHVLFEGSAGTLSEKEGKVRDCAAKTGYSRVFILDSVE
jgi:hypothetical protein